MQKSKAEAKGAKNHQSPKRFHFCVPCERGLTGNCAELLGSGGGGGNKLAAFGGREGEGGDNTLACSDGDACCDGVDAVESDPATRRAGPATDARRDKGMLASSTSTSIADADVTSWAAAAAADEDAGAASFSETRRDTLLSRDTTVADDREDEVGRAGRAGETDRLGAGSAAGGASLKRCHLLEKERVGERTSAVGCETPL